MNQYTVSFTPNGKTKATWITGVLASSLEEALRIGRGMHAKGEESDSGTFEVNEDLV